MSVWTTKSLKKDSDYIVFQHSLRGINYIVNGIRFRNGYAVVEKNSKNYYMLKKIPVLRNAKEYPLTHLKKLSFITRTSDIRTVYGYDVYLKFLEEEKLEKYKLEQNKKLNEEKKEKEYNNLRELHLEAKELGKTEIVEELEKQIAEVPKCLHRTKEGLLCKENALEFSPSGYCHKHLLDDPKIEEFGITKPSFMTKKEKHKYKVKAIETLKKAKRANKF